MSKTNQQLRLATGRRLAYDESFSENGTTCSASLSPGRKQSWKQRTTDALGFGTCQ
jgi:hypothetical protein